MATTPNAPGLVGSAGATNTNYRRSRRSELAIWWREIDRVLLGLVLFLIAVGAAAIAAASPASARRLSTAVTNLDDLHFFTLHLRWLGLGLVAMLAASLLDKDMARRAAILFAGVMLAALMLVPFIGSEVNGAKRWINLGMSFQPSSFLKVGYPILLAWILTWGMRDPKMPVVAISASVMVLICALLVFQPDFGTALLYGGVWFALVLLYGLSTKRIVMTGVAGVTALAAAYWFYPNARERIDTFMFGGTPYSHVDLADKTLQAGGWSGTGFWLGTRKLALPEAHTDYIFSVIGEEFGLASCAIVILLFLAIVSRVLLRLVEEEDLFTVLAGTGLIAQFGGQAFINILVNLQLFPSKGMTLPLISYGGSSTVAMCASIGLLLAITRRNPFIKREGFSLGDIGDKR
ncbi:MAG: putative peptidoglycan glycosyltransferase FtsW [Novosphingobium sp.]|nr:putative peptidoglycan glycosyltransferase FtsW [Novosphingobium sp.]